MPHIDITGASRRIGRVPILSDITLAFMPEDVAWLRGPNVAPDVAAEISQGQSDRQILDGLANSFGDEVIIDPSTSGPGLALWVAPGLAILIGGWAMRSLRRDPGADSP